MQDFFEANNATNMATLKDDNSSDSAVPGTADGTTIITEVLPTDILMGRGHRMINHPGNARFRELVQTYRDAYSRAGRTRRKQEIARQVLNEVVTQHNGRFLAMLDLSKTPMETAASTDAADRHAETWVLANPAAVLEKIKQTLRNTDRPQKLEAKTDKQGSIQLHATQAQAHQIDGVEGLNLAPDATVTGMASSNSLPADSNTILRQLERANQEQAQRTLQERHQRQRDILHVQHLLDLQQHRMTSNPSMSLTIPLFSTIPNSALVSLPTAFPHATFGTYSGLVSSEAARLPLAPPPPLPPLQPLPLPPYLPGAAQTTLQINSAATRSNGDPNAIPPSRLLALRQILDRSSSTTTIGECKRQKRK